MRKIIVTIAKNFSVLLRNKLSLVILLLGPMLIILLMGFFYFNSNLYSLSIGVVSQDDSELTYFFVDEIKKSQFTIHEFYEKNTCLDAIKSGIIHGCIILPENFVVNEKSTNQIIISLDTSRGDIVTILENLAIDQVSSISEKIQIKETNKLLESVIYVENRVGDNFVLVEKLLAINENLKGKNKLLVQYSQNINLKVNSEDIDFSGVEGRLENVNEDIISTSNEISELLIGVDSSIGNLTFTLSSETLVEEDKIDDIIDIIKEDSNRVKVKSSNLNKSFDLKKLNSEVEDYIESLETLTKSIDSLANNINDVIGESDTSVEDFEDQLNDLNSNNLEILNKLSTLNIRDSKAIAMPIEVNVENVVTDSKTHLSSLFPSLIVSLICIISIIFASTFVLSERKSQAFFRNFLSRNSEFQFFIADLLSLFFIVFFQMFLIIIVYYLLFLRVFSVEIFLLMLYIIPSILIFIMIGMIIGYFVNNESSNVITSFLVIFILLALSGQILPLESLSSFILSLVSYNPYLVSESLIRKFLLFNSSFRDLLNSFIMLLVYTVVLFIIGVILESFSKRRELFNFFSNVSLSIKNKRKKKN